MHFGEYTRYALNYWRYYHKNYYKKTKQNKNCWYGKR